MNKRWMSWALASTLALALAGCGGGGDDDGGDNEPVLNASRLTSITVYLSSEPAVQEGLGSTYTVWGENDGADAILIGTSDKTATFEGDYDGYYVQTDASNNIHLDAVKGSNGKYYIDVTTPELVLTLGNTDAITTPTLVSYEFANAPDNKGTSVGILFDNGYEGGYVRLDRRGFTQ